MRDAEEPEPAAGSGGEGATSAAAEAAAAAASAAGPTAGEAVAPRAPGPSDAVDRDPEDDPGDDPGDHPRHESIFAVGLPGSRPADAVTSFRRLAARIADEVLALAPESAPAGTRAARSGRLADLSPDGAEHADGVLADALAALDAVDDTVLAVADGVDLEILRVWVAGLQWELMDGAAAHDPLLHLPARLLPPPEPVLGDRARPDPTRPDLTRPDLIRPDLDRATLDRLAGALRTAQGRLEDLPARLAHARDTLHGLSGPAVDAALDRTRRLQDTLTADLARLTAPVEDPDALAPGLHPALGAALGALAEHSRWLHSVRGAAHAEPRIGAQRYGARLWYRLDVELDPDALLVRAESDLLAVEEELAELAGLLGAAPGPDGVRDLLRSVAADAGQPPGAALAEIAAELRAVGLVTVPDTLPEPARCPIDGRAESSLPDTPALDAVGGALREVVAAHCGVPGHQLQAAHAARLEPVTPARLVAPSPLFVEGWAVHAESLLTLSDSGTPAQRARRRVAQLALQLRRTVRCVVDVRCHVHGLSARDAAAVLVDRAHLGPDAAAAAVTSTLVHPVRGSIGYIGDHLVSDVVARCGAARPDAGARAVHDSVLAHGPVPPRHLAVLLGLPAESSGRH